MKAAEQGEAFPLLHPADRRVVARRDAQKLFETICHAAWASGDPGLIFLDTIARDNPTPGLGEIESTNPCGEVPLLPHESCNLGSINLARMLGNMDKAPTVDWDKLRALVHDAVRFLDDVISVNQFPVDSIREATLGNRKIGLGVMGFGEMCILLGISYASEEALRLANELMSFIAAEALKASVQLADERSPFPNWKQSKYANTLRLRNATLTSIAPTGTIGIIAGTSSGIEPLFGLAYRRTNVLNHQTLTEFNPLFLRYLEQRKLANKQVLDAVAHYGCLHEQVALPEDVRRLFVTALEITPKHHVGMQAAFQKHVDNAVSKTVNLPTGATAVDVANVYRLADKLGCKGITVFRYGSKSAGLLQLGLGETAYEREHFAKCDPGACRL
jgi:ribonucleoside-diphosphate reductase alpha chain